MTSEFQAGDCRGRARFPCRIKLGLPIGIVVPAPTGHILCTMGNEIEGSLALARLYVLNLE